MNKYTVLVSMEHNGKIKDYEVHVEAENSNSAREKAYKYMKKLGYKTVPYLDMHK